MNQRYKIIPSLVEKDTLTISSEAGRSLGIEKKRLLYIRFGLRAYEVKLCFSEELDHGIFTLSNEVINDLAIPIFCRFEIRISKNELMIGPYIGMLAERSKESLDKVVEHFKSYVYNYEDIAGAILAFSVEGTDITNQRIKGYVYNPETDSWIEGNYCYPAAIFKRVGILKELKNHFESLLKGAVFNNYVFSKWEAHEWLSSFDNIKMHLPLTIRYENPWDAVNFLKENDSAYVKPIYGSQGTGIVKISKKGTLYFARYSKDNEETEEWFEDRSKFMEFLSKYIGKDKFIIQSSLNLVSKEDSTIDFRLLILKDKDGEWQDIGMVARHGVKKSITSNVSTGGSAEIGEHTLKEIFSFTEEQVSIFRKQMSDLAIETAKVLEETGVACGNLGIDMGIDNDRKIWIIEVNHIDPNHTIAINAKDKQMFYKARLFNMLYAKKLAGF